MENQLFQYNPTSEGNTENGHKVTVLGLNSEYTVKYGLNPPFSSGHISPYIPRLVLIRNKFEMLNWGPSFSYV